MTEVISSVKCISLKNKSTIIQHIIEGMTHFKGKYHTSWDLCDWTLVCPEKNEQCEARPYILYKNHCCRSISFQALKQMAQEYGSALFLQMDRLGDSHKCSFDSRSLHIIAEAIMNKSKLGYDQTIDTSTILPLGLENQTEGFFSKKFDVDYIPTGEYPDKRLFRREITNFDAMCAFFGVMIKGGPNHQYLWIYGKGAVGKTLLINSIVNHIGKEFVHETTISAFGDRFFASKVYDKRLIICEEGDADDMSSNTLKRFVGDGRLSVEHKFQNGAITVKNQAMVVVISNDLPNVKLDEATRRRIIFCHFPEITKENFMDNAASEMQKWMPKFLGFCVQMTGLQVNSRGIKADYTEYENFAKDEVRSWIDALNMTLEFNVEKTIAASEFRRVIRDYCFDRREKVSESQISNVIFKVNERLGNALKYERTEEKRQWRGVGNRYLISKDI